MVIFFNVVVEIYVFILVFWVESYIMFLIYYDNNLEGKIECKWICENDGLRLIR